MVPNGACEFDGEIAGTGGIKHALQDQNSWFKQIGEKGLAAFLRDTIGDRVDLKSAEPGLYSQRSTFVVLNER